MGIRLSGMVSGLDTDSIIKEMIKAHTIKKTRIEQKRSKLEWSQDKWKELNSKIYNLYASTLANMRLEGSYQTKKVTSSNETVLTAAASSSAAPGNHSLQVKALASAQHLTSDKVVNAKGAAYSSSEKLTALGMTEGSVIRIQVGVGEAAKVSLFEVAKDSTINDYVRALQQSGLNAAYDAGQGRFFISSSQTGASNMFSMEAIRTVELDSAKKSIAGLVTDQDALSKFYTEYDAALQAYVFGFEEQKDSLKEKSDSIVKSFTDEFYEKPARDQVIGDKIVQINDNPASEAYQSIARSVNGQYFENGVDSAKGFKKEILEAIKKQNPEMTTEEVELEAWQAYNEGFESAIRSVAELYANTEEGQEKIKGVLESDEYKSSMDVKAALLRNAIEDYTTERTDVLDGSVSKITDTGYLDKLGMSNLHIEKTTSAGGAVSYDVYPQGSNWEAPLLKKASDAVIIMNGAELTGPSNAFNVAGITFNLKNLSREDEFINVNITNDIKAVTDMVKNFVKEYNSILGSMNELYFANLAKGYEPLTDEEKSQMSEKQIEMWENKIKDSLLRRDPTLRGIISAFRAMTETKTTAGGKAYSLSTFGITTSDYTEKGILHIFGDASDPTFANKEDKLTKLFEDNPEDAAKAFTGFVKELYTTLQDKMKSSEVSSALSFYNDKLMSKQLGKYDAQIKDWEKKLDRMEERYYKQFTAMEKAMATLNSQSSSLASLLNNNNNNRNNN